MSKGSTARSGSFVISSARDWSERARGELESILKLKWFWNFIYFCRGAQEATGEVIVYLDAHCEVNKNWLPPLLAPIYRDGTVMTVPIIDGIDHKNFEYRPVYADGHHYRGIFEWGMLYKENEVPKREQKRRAHNSEPYQSPTHAGGLFAINREYFLKLGAYDPGLLVWGGESSWYIAISRLLVTKVIDRTHHTQ